MINKVFCSVKWGIVHFCVLLRQTTSFVVVLIDWAQMNNTNS